EKKSQASLSTRIHSSQPIYAPLRLQARSLPEISKYLRVQYPDLEDNLEAVSRLEVPAWIEHPIFWWDTAGRGGSCKPIAGQWVGSESEYNHSFENL
ncbi:unnamed protein product, partial [Amoebophrya sp. A25]